MPKAKPKLIRKGTKMSLFDFDDADLSDFDMSDGEQSSSSPKASNDDKNIPTTDMSYGEQSSTSSKASNDDKNIPTTGTLKNDKAQREGHVKIPVELPDLGH